MIGMYKGDWDGTGGEFRKQAKQRVTKIRKMMTIDQCPTDDQRRCKKMVLKTLTSFHPQTFSRGDQ